MILTRIILILTGILYTETKKDVHLDLTCNGCSDGDSDGDDMYGLDGEEMAHADWKAGKYVMTLPKFAEQFQYRDPETYQGAVADYQICKQNLAVAIQSYKNPVVALAPPSTSIYPRDEVKVGTENILICYIYGVYPPRLNVTWTMNNEIVTRRVSRSQSRLNYQDGTFTIFSTLKFTPQEGDMYTCTVEHSALERPITREFDVEVPEEPSLGPSVFCGVGLTLGLLGVATGTFFLVKGNQCN